MHPGFGVKKRPPGTGTRGCDFGVCSRYCVGALVLFRCGGYSSQFTRLQAKEEIQKLVASSVAVVAPPSTSPPNPESPDTMMALHARFRWAEGPPQRPRGSDLTPALAPRVPKEGRPLIGAYGRC